MRRPSRALLVGAVAVAVCGVLTGCSSDVSAVLPLGPVPTGARVVVIGDSITIGHGLRPAQAWPELLAARDHLRLTDLGCDGAGVLAEGDDQCSATYEVLAVEAAALHP
ncbi:MAG: hypothetical protein V4737_02255, partial [Curtobacterium sp.]